MKCKDCNKMVCRVFYAKEERWVGYCKVKETFTQGNWDCWANDKADSGADTMADTMPTPF